MGSKLYVYKTRIPVNKGRVSSFDYEGDIVVDGLTNYFDATKVASYPGTGTTWFNLKTGANNATLFGNPSFISTNPKYFDFTTSTYASCAYSHSNTGTYTICAWVLSTNVNRERAYTVLGTSFWGIFLGANPDGTVFFRTTNGSVGQTVTSPNLNFNSDPNKWYYLCGICIPANVQSTNNQRLYSNGVLNSQGTFGNNNWRTGTNLYINRIDSGNRDAEVSMVKVYNRALTDSEILQNYNATKGKYGL